MTETTGNAVAEWSPDSGAALPAYLTGAMDDMGTNIPDRDRVPSLSYEGKVWQIVKDGDKHKLQHTNSDGDVVPVPVMRLVVLNFNAERGRAYYEGEYDPSTTTAPKCWSADGKAPDASVQDPPSSACATCPMAVKGSKIREGKEMVACGSHRMLAIAPAFDIEGEPLRLKIAVTSDYDKQVVEHGWFAFRQYVDFLKSRGITHTALVVTKVKFDNTVAYPKLLFALDRLLQPHEVTQVQTALKNEKIDGLLNEKWTAAGVDGTPSNDSDIRPRPEDPNHFHAIGTPEELWWDENTQAWVKPWATQAASPPPPASPPAPEKAAPAKTPLERAVDDGWQLHPDNSAYYFKDSDVVATAVLEARYAGNAASSSTAPDPQPTTAPSPEAAPVPAAEGNAGPEPTVQTVAPASTAEPQAVSPSTAPTADVQQNPIAAAEADGWIKHPDNPDYHYKGSDVVLTTELETRYSAAPAEPAAGSTDVPSDVASLLEKWT